MEQVNPDYYDSAYYGVSDKGKPFIDYDGELKYHASYCAKNLTISGQNFWEGWVSIIGAWQKMWDPANMLDVGAGPGSLVNQAVKYGIDAWGIDYSRWCVENALPAVKKRILLAPADRIPFRDDSFDLVVSTDLCEHLYLPQVQPSLREMFRVAKDIVFHNICCSRPGDTVKVGGKVQDALYFLEEGEPVPEIWQPLAVAGHVTVQREEFWEEQLDEAGNGEWRRDKDTEEWFREMTDPVAIQNWINILIYTREQD